MTNSPLPSLKCPLCGELFEDNEESLAMHIEIGHILPYYIPKSKIKAELQRLEHSEMEKVVSLSVIDLMITAVEDFGESYHYTGVIEILEGLKKEAKAAEPMSGTIQSLKAILGHEYYK